VSADGENYFAAEGNKVALSSLGLSVGNATLTVVAKKGDKKIAEESFTFEVKKLAAPEKPTITVSEETNEKAFTWNEVENAKNYLVKANDEKNWGIRYTNVYSPSATGDYTIVVKCREYYSKDVYYLESDESPKSDTLSYLQGPALSGYSANEISWSAEIEFDTYNVWVNGELAKENVTSPLNLVTGEDPVLTQTGEYDVQIEGIKDGVSAWSNVYTEFGTTNINPGEIYSFDNRKLNTPLPRPTMYFVDVAEEELLDSAHSGKYVLKVEGADQLNLVKYASSGINDIDYRTIVKASYWVYVPAFDGYSGDTIDARAVSTVIYDGYGSDAEHERIVFYPQEKEIPIGEWTKVTFICENEYERVFLIGRGASVAMDDESYQNIPLYYIDDISYEETDPVTDYTNRFLFAGQRSQGSWFAPHQTFDFGEEFANKTVVLEMKICGSADPETNDIIGFAYDLKRDENGQLITGRAGYQAGCYQEIPRELITSYEWKDYSMSVTLDENGQYRMGIVTWFRAQKGEEGYNVVDGLPYIIYVKDVKVTEGYNVTFISDGETYLETSYKAGDAIVLPDEPYKNGYTFKGWSVDGSTVIDLTNAKVNNTVTYTAVFEETVTDYEYRYLSGVNGFYTDETLKLSFGSQYANKKLIVSADVCGTLTGLANHGNAAYGYYYDTTEQVNSESAEKSYIRYYFLGEGYGWHTLALALETNDAGDVYVKPSRLHSISAHYGQYITYFKNITVLAAEEADYVVATTYWDHGNYATFDFGSDYANKTVNISMDILGASANQTSIALGLLCYPTATGKDAYKRVYVDSDLRKGTWRKIAFDATLDESGKLSLTVCRTQGNGTGEPTYGALIKNVEISGATAFSTGAGWEYSSDYKNNTTNVITAPEAYWGKTVAVSMGVKIAVNVVGSASIGLHVMDYSSDGETGSHLRFYTILKGADVGSIDWRGASFMVNVPEDGKIRLLASVTGGGNYSEFIIFMKDIQFIETEYLSTTSSTAWGSNADFATNTNDILTIPSEYAEKTVTVTMKVKVRVFSAGTTPCGLQLTDWSSDSVIGTHLGFVTVLTQNNVADLDWTEISFEITVPSDGKIRLVASRTANGGTPASFTIFAKDASFTEN
ncbi:MAG: InlB B-repeat-containing protein, partial [Clostridia bacterium]|nr:InlB B-repeat-containing protein [Clostridia bacterium]